MGTSGKGTAIVGYNVQTAVDAQHHLIVAHDVTNVGNDRDQLSNMAGQAKAAMGVEALDVLADRGYYWTSKCAECPLKTRCTTGKERRIKRWEHEAVIDAMQDRLDRRRRACASAARPSNTRSAPSRPGWAPPTSRPEPSKRSEQR